MIKRFLEWFGIKEKIHIHAGGYFDFREGEVWWCGVGENIGIEINGKGSEFSRPVFIYKRFDSHGFMGIPLSTKIKYGTWYVSIMIKEYSGIAQLAQARVFSSARLYERIGILDEEDQVKIKSGFIRLYS